MPVAGKRLKIIKERDLVKIENTRVDHGEKMLNHR
jgi:hypothetical protein